jgi:hypothetical protein
MRRIGTLFAAEVNDVLTQRSLARLRTELARLGWIEGKNLRFEHRFVHEPDQIRPELGGQLTLGGPGR